MYVAIIVALVADLAQISFLRFQFLIETVY